MGEASDFRIELNDKSIGKYWEMSTKAVLSYDDKRISKTTSPSELMNNLKVTFYTSEDYNTWMKSGEFSIGDILDMTRLNEWSPSTSTIMEELCTLAAYDCTQSVDVERFNNLNTLNILDEKHKKYCGFKNIESLVKYWFKHSDKSGNVKELKNMRKADEIKSRIKETIQNLQKDEKMSKIILDNKFQDNDFVYIFERTHGSLRKLEFQHPRKFFALMEESGIKWLSINGKVRQNSRTRYIEGESFIKLQ
jgi:hypothetical protein